jgi:hypothetical protein
MVPPARRWDHADLCEANWKPKMLAGGFRCDLGPLSEGQMVREACFKQHTHAMVTGNVGRCHEHGIFRNAHVVQVVGFAKQKAFLPRVIGFPRVPGGNPRQKHHA